MHVECNMRKKNLQIDFGLISYLYGRKIAEWLHGFLIKFSILNNVLAYPDCRAD